MGAKRRVEDKDALLSRVLNVSAFLVAAMLLFVSFVYSEVTTAIAFFGVLLFVIVAAIAYRHQKGLKAAVGQRSVRYGATAALNTLLVTCILVTLNFLNYNHFWKKDLTKSGIHSLSEQSIKILRDLKQDVKLTAYVKAQGKEQVRTVVESFQYFTKKMSVEYVDPDRDPTRARAANIKKFGTVILEVGKKEIRIDDINEEKLTNALIKIAKEKNQTVCFLVGHGEKSTDSKEADGYAAVKDEMTSSSWDIKTVNLLEDGNVPPACDALMVVGPNKDFFDKELTILKEWLDNGGRALFALDPDVRKGEDNNRQINSAILAPWYVHVQHNLVIDPSSRLNGVQASIPLVRNFNRDHAITKDFQALSLFPLASGVEILKGAAAGMKSNWLAKSTAAAFAETNFKDLAAGKAKFDQGIDVQGPIDMMVAVEGKKPNSNASRETRLVVMGSSAVATNGFARHAQNIDLFMNAVSWLVNDESLISIRPKEIGTQAITLSQTEGRLIQLLTMIFVPLLTFGLGVAVYIRRRKL